MPIGVTRSLDSWDVFNSYVERNLDVSAYSAAHPDDVLVVAGPPRFDSIDTGQANGITSLLPIGQIQQASISSQLPVQPTKALGSTRKFFLMDTATNNITLARLVMNGRNLVRAMYHVAVEAGIDVGDPAIIGTPASYSGRANQQWWCNLDSPIYRLPVGIGFIMKDRGGSAIGGMYAEVVHLNSWNLSFASGQSAVVENCTMVCDRILPFQLSNSVGQLASLFDAAQNIPNENQLEVGRAGVQDNIN